MIIFYTANKWAWKKCSDTHNLSSNKEFFTVFLLHDSVLTLRVQKNINLIECQSTAAKVQTKTISNDIS